MEEFNFEKLEVWQKSVVFADRVIELLDRIELERKHYRLFEQLEAAATSISMNIAEGKGRYSKKEFIHFLYISRGSLFEVITLLTIFKNRDWINEKQFDSLKEQSLEIGKMLNALINSIKE